MRSTHIIPVKKRSLTNTGDEPDLGPVSGRDCGLFMPAGDEEIAWPSKDKIEDEIDDEEDRRGCSSDKCLILIYATFLLL